MKSILQSKKECYVCKTKLVEEHHQLDKKCENTET